MKQFDGIVLYSTEELAEQLGVSRQMIRRMFRDRLLQGRKIGNSWYATAEAVKAYLTGAEQHGTPSN